MNSQPKYKTKQRYKILDYLIANKTKHVTADNIVEYFRNNDEPIGRATIYRYLDNLVEENVIRKYVVDAKEPACFQFIENDEKCIAHYHMKCTKCGKLFHLHCDDLKKLQEHILKEHNFKLDICKTVLYGTCEECLKLVK